MSPKLLRRRLLPSTFLSLLLAVAAGQSACSSASDSAGGEPGPGVDQPSNGTVRVNEAAIIGTVDGGKLSVSVPITGERGGEGALSATIVSVDGRKRLETVSVSYDVAAGEKSTLQATFRVPADVAAQVDWARYSLRVEDGSAQGLRVTSSLLRVVQPYDLRLEGPATVSRDRTVAYRVRAEHPRTKAPLADVQVQLEVQQDGKAVQTKSARTNATGDAVVQVGLPTAGSYSLRAATSFEGTGAVVAHAMTVAEPERKVLVTTDKPIYQPGQTVHLRALALAAPRNLPVTGAKALFEVFDGKGNKVFHQELDTDDYGVAATEFVIGSIVNEGTYRTSVTVGDSKTERTVTVSHYALPKFGVDVQVDRPWYGPGQTVAGTLDARYFFGKVLEGADVVIEGYTLDVGETVFARVVGKTDAAGKMTFSVTLPSSLAGLPLDQGNALASLRITVTDTAGQAVTKETALTVAANAVAVTVVPEATTLVPGIENRLRVFASDPLGAPVAGAAVTLSIGDTQLQGTTDPYGQALLLYTPPSVAESFTVAASVTPSGGTPVDRTFTFGGQTGEDHLLVRADRSVYAVGDTVNVEILATGAARHAYVDWLTEGQAVDMRTVDLSSGSGTFSVPVDVTRLGSNRVQAYVVDPGGNVVRAGRTLFVRGDAALDVKLTTDKPTYAPGEPAKLTFSVADQTGAPAVAALGVQIVDQAVFALVDSRPGLLRTFFEMEDEFAQPRYEIQAPPISLTDVLFDGTRTGDAAAKAASQVEAEAAFAAIGGSGVTGIQEGSWAAVEAGARTLLTPILEDQLRTYVAALKPVVLAKAMALQETGCTPQIYWCPDIQRSFWEALTSGVASSAVVADLWGTAFTLQGTGYEPFLTLTSAGPDELPGTGDDLTISISADDLNLGTLLGPVFADAGAWEPGGGFGGEGGFNGSGGAVASGGTTGGGTGGTGGSTDEGPRVRRSFPETLYVNPEVITTPDGKATIDVPMADSITEWRVSTLAHTSDGKLGGGVGGVTVFQDFFVDVSFPATLTRGDQVEFPIAVYNYLKAPQTVSLSLDPGVWYTALGATTLDVTLQPGEVKGVRFPVRVEQVGQQALTVRALGTAASDAVQRTVRVVPDGKAFPATFSGSLGTGSVSHAVDFPANAVPGSEQLYLTVFPGYLSQVVQGMDSLLQVPSGCFEQTTSTTWPNVLALDYMETTKQVTPEIQLKADGYINAGYQRLLTFEHPGGGFSWFGTQDPAPFLSVTAFGLMEFGDMAKVATVDPDMVERTRSWLVAQQKPDGSWPGDQTEFFSFHTSGVRNTAFVVWSLGSAGYTGPELDRGLAYVKNELGKEPADAYTLGLVANAFEVTAPTDAFGTQVLADLDAAKIVDGEKFHWDTGSTQTDFYGSGTDGAIATTGIVTHAMLLDGGHSGTVNGALQYLAASKDSLGGFGSTQATIWTLKSLVLAATRGTETAAGTLSVAVDGAPFTTVPLLASQPGLMTTVDLSTLATTGSHDVALSFAGTGRLTYGLTASHHLPWVDVVPDTGPLAVSVAYDKTTLRVNETVQATVTVQNTTASTENMILVTVGIPPGFAVAEEDLAAYETAGTLSHHELTERQLTLYLTKLAPSATQTFTYHLVATMPVKADDGGASAYLYYEPQRKVTAAARQLEVTGG